MTDLPLAGVRVLDLSRVLAGPLASMVLADLGAEVIKVEHPVRGDDTRDWGVAVGQTETSYYYAFNRNKKSVALDLGTPEGAAAAADLAARADVILENFRAGGMEKFGLGYDTLRARNPALVYCSIAGYDRHGDETSRPGYDLVIQGEAGLMAINGEAGRPPVKFGVAAVDMMTGMYAAQAILAALLAARASGTGRRIDLALFDCGIALGAYYGLEALWLGEDPVRVGNSHPSVLPYGVFAASDGDVILAIGNNRQYRDFCGHVLVRPDLADDPRFATNLLRRDNREVLIPLFEDAVSRLVRRDLLARAAEVGVPCGEVLGLHAALYHRRTREAGLVVDHHQDGRAAPFFAPPWRIDGERLPASPPPRLGADTDAVLSCGWTPRQPHWNFTEPPRPGDPR